MVGFIILMIQLMNRSLRNGVRKKMIRLLKRLLGIKPKPISYVWLHIHSQASEGVIGWSASNRRIAIKGKDQL